jgi:hypothetical protein
VPLLRDVQRLQDRKPIGGRPRIVYYNSPAYLQARHGLPPELVQKYRHQEALAMPVVK